MIKISEKYYLYRHIRLDKDEPFYIGIGTKLSKDTNNERVLFKRAYDSPKRRNKIWRDIEAKTKYQTEILLESNDYNFILQKEIEFIKLYGRINNNTGTLANLTDGGEGSLGAVVSEEKRNKISIGNRGRIKSEQEKKLISENLSIPVINTKTHEIFSSIKEASDKNNIPYGTLYYRMTSETQLCDYRFLDDSLNVQKRSPRIGKDGIKVINTETGEIFKTAKEAAEFEGMDLFKFYDCLGWKKKYFKYKRIKTKAYKEAKK